MVSGVFTGGGTCASNLSPVPGIISESPKPATLSLGMLKPIGFFGAYN